ncbi:uncharacterized protein N0V89_003188 [Didymosphaeria variabile]|uniref:Lipocalin-like domain-containing protein n=1 Tax=Didymosphaeria variabile TaxID=1932322 RepID=A0A9W8XU34_9PLEO|nr:uncharacterized protein N0V89_003188 [Didymosphaeria variabile]KAJ4358604.1 hypothetical protein N0V89_003188 [Didymosphaeria variabile]
MKRPNTSATPRYQPNENDAQIRSQSTKGSPVMKSHHILTTTLLGLSSAASTPNRMPGVYRMSSLSTYINGTLDNPEIWGPNPIGTLVFTQDYVIVQNSDPRLPLFPPGHFFTQVGTPEQNAAIVAGTVAHSGTYKVSEDGVFANITFIGSTIPNYVGTTVGNDVFTFVLREDGSGMRELLRLTPGFNISVEWEKVECI